MVYALIPTEYLSNIFMIGVMLLIIGLVLIVIDILLSSSLEGSKVRGGGVIIIGPLPIIFGTDRKSALVLGIVGTVITLILITTYIIINGRG